MDLIKKVMGSAQAKNSKSSPAKGLAKLKTENEHVGRGMMGQRRSTGQRYNERELGGGRIRRPDLPVVPERSDEGKVINGGGKRDLQWGNTEDGEVVDGWPKWLIDNVPKEALEGLVRKSAESYDKIDKVGHGTYSNVYKARDKDTGKIVALKKVRFDSSEPKSVKFMAREIIILRKLDHPNVIKLEGLATSRMQYSLYLVFDFMQSDLVRVISQPDGRLTEPQVKCYMHQLLSGLQHCHERGILHRDIKGSNLLIDKNGILKIADFGLANYFSPNQKQPLTSRVVTLWYRAPELLLGTTNYGVGIDLWSAGCLLAEMFAGRPIMPGRTEVEQLHRIFKLCGAPSEDYWKKLKLSTTFRPPACRPCLFEAFQDFPESSLGLLTILLALDPAYRGSASSALQNEFFSTSPLACNLSGLPVIYNKDDDSTTTIEPRKNRRSRMKHRSKTYCKRKTKDQDSELPKQENVPNTEGPEEKIVELDVQSHLSFSCTSSASSSAKQSSHTESLPFLISPIADSQPRMPLLTPDHPNAGKSIKNQPPLPASKMLSNNYNDNVDSKYKLNQVRRSASTREFIKLNQNKDLEALYI